MNGEPTAIDSGIEAHLDSCLATQHQATDVTFVDQLAALERILARELTPDQLQILHPLVIDPQRFSLLYRGKTIIGRYRGSDRTSGGWDRSCAGLFNCPSIRPCMLWGDLLPYLTDIRLALEQLKADAFVSAEKQ